MYVLSDRLLDWFINLLKAHWLIVMQLTNHIIKINNPIDFLEKGWRGSAKMFHVFGTELKDPNMSKLPLRLHHNLFLTQSSYFCGFLLSATSTRFFSIAYNIRTYKSYLYTNNVAVVWTSDPIQDECGWPEAQGKVSLKINSWFLYRKLEREIERQRREIEQTC